VYFTLNILVHKTISVLILSLGHAVEFCYPGIVMSINGRSYKKD